MNRLLRTLISVYFYTPFLGFFFLVVASTGVSAQIITTVTGTTSIGDGGPATDANINTPNGVAVDGLGNIYVSDTENNRIRKVNVANGTISTIAGTGTYGYSGDGGAAINAKLNSPSGLALDLSGNLYIADRGNHRIRKISAANGTISTVAGTGTGGYNGDGILAINAQINIPYGVYVDASDNIFIPDRGNHRIRMVSAANGTISTVAGTGTGGFSGDEGAATIAQINFPMGVYVDGSGNIYIADQANHRIRKVTAANGKISTLAGTGIEGYSGNGGAATSATFSYPDGVWGDGTGNIFVADHHNHAVRKIIAANGTISTVAGTSAQGYNGDGGAPTGAQLNFPINICIDGSNNLYIADKENHRIRKVSATNGTISTVVGTGSRTYRGDGGAATNARLNEPSGVAVDGSGNIYIADQYNHRIRKINAANGIISTIAGTTTYGFSGDGGAATNARLTQPTGVALDAAGNLYIADQYNHRIRKVNATNGNISTVAGNGSANYSGDGGAATSASLNYPTGVAIDAAGNLYIADKMNHRIRKVLAVNGTISTIAGNGSGGFSGDYGAATSARLNNPMDVSVDAAGNLYIADKDNHRIRKVNASDGTISTVAGNSTISEAPPGGGTPGGGPPGPGEPPGPGGGMPSGGYRGDGGAATMAELNSPTGVWVDGAGNLYIADQSNHRIRKVNATNSIISTVVGNGSSGYSGDGGAATAAMLYKPADVVLDGSGNLYIADQSNSRIRKVAPLATNVNPVNPPAICAASDLSLTAIASNFSPTSFNWSSEPAGISASGAITLLTAPTVSVPTIFTITVNASDGQLSAATSFTLTVNPVPSVSINPSSTTLTCTIPMVSLSAVSSGTYGWSTGENTETISATSAGTYSVTVTNVNGCTATTSVEILVDNNSPVASINPSSATLTCANPSATLTASGGGTYQWSTGESTASISATAGGTYSVTATGVNGCTASASEEVMEDVSIPSANITPGSATLTCANPTVTLTANGSGTYQWSTGETTAQISVTSIGTYSVTVTGSNGCTATTSALIEQDNSAPSVSINASTTLLTCATPTISLSATGSGTYHWSTGATSSTIDVSTADIYSVTVTGANGCTASTSIKLMEDSTPPVASISPSSATLTCAIPSITLTAGGAGTYHWSTGENTGQISATAMGTYSVTVTGENGCTASAGAEVVQDNTKPSAFITPSSATLTCANPSITLTADSGGTYQWSTGESTTAISATVIGTYSVTVTGANGCTASASVVISQDINAASISISPSIGTPTGATLTCTNPTVSLSAVGSGTYRWSTGATSQVISVSTANTYSVTVTGTNGCTASSSIQVSQDNSAPSVNITPSSATLTCANTSSTLTAGGSSGTYRWNTGATSSTISVSVANIYSFTLTGTNGCTASASAQVFNNVNPPSVNIAPSSATLTCASPSTTLVASGGGTYRWSTGETTASISATAIGTYSVTVTGANGCTATQTASVFANTATPTVSLVSSGTLSCSISSVTLTAGGGVTYLFSGPGVVSQSANKAVVNLAGTYAVTATAANGCTSSTTALVSYRNCPPTVSNAIPPQSATILVPFSYTIPANTFSDSETPNDLIITTYSLPKGLTFTAPATISGTPLTESGTIFTILVTAFDPSGSYVQTTLKLSVYPGASACDMSTVKDGAWSDTSVWSCGRLPVSTDVLTLKHAVSIPANYVGQALRIQYNTGGKIIFNTGSRIKQGIF
ncbi:hypothetical protein IC229_12175 [Spirosoma sp. BT702]|uniref:Uncharacterized protein n=1 Tax=Spirosoma profusum TaxID=2771354 RepID=A0A927ASK1_9BACT|nr:putative Ig domain-containing protein [Spirosoma profusum]MBD2701400.1 hypothetical protein [Spirosoma profusum]